MTAHVAVTIAAEWRELAALIPLLRQRLEPRQIPSETHMPAKSRPPIDMNASRLLADIDAEVDFYVHVLLDEVATFTAPLDLAERVRSVADHVGHFLGAEDREGLDMLDTAQTLISRALGLIDPQPGPQWAGPCAVAECDGEMFRTKEQGPAKCDVCGSLMTFADWSEWLERHAEIVLMDRGEILTALKTLGHPVKANTLAQWVTRKRVTPATVAPEMFRLSDVLGVAEKSRPKLGRVAA